MNRPLDDVDKALLRELKNNARLPIAELAARIRVSESTAHRRLRALIDAHVITRFTVETTQGAGREGVEALVKIRLQPTARSGLDVFYDFLRGLASVSHVYFLAGGDDFVVHVRGEDARELRHFVSEVISSRPEVAETNTSLIFEHGEGSAATPN